MNTLICTTADEAKLILAESQAWYQHVLLGTTELDRAIILALLEDFKLDTEIPHTQRLGSLVAFPLRSVAVADIPTTQIAALLALEQAETPKISVFCDDLLVFRGSLAAVKAFFFAETLALLNHYETVTNTAEDKKQLLTEHQLTMIRIQLIREWDGVRYLQLNGYTVHLPFNDDIHNLFSDEYLELFVPAAEGEQRH